MILLVGAGAVGSILASYLGAAGRLPLKVYARPKDLPGLEAASGLRVDDVDGKTVASAPKPGFVTTLDLAGVDYLLIAVKFGALEKLLDELPDIPPTCTVVSTLNGIEALRVLKRRLPQARILPMTIMYNGQLLGPLHGQITTKPIIVLGQGERDVLSPPRHSGILPIGGEDERLAEAFAGSGMKVMRAQGEAAVWGKLLINLANAVCAITHMSFKDLFTRADMRAIYVRVLDEAVGLLQKAGIAYQLPMPIPYSSYRWMLLHAGPLPWWIAQLKNGVRAGSYPSMVADVEQGRVTEVAQLNGEIARLGREKGVATPVAERIVQLVQAMEGKLPPPYLSPEQLSAQLR